MAMQRPAWTICLALMWILILPGIILTHSAVGNLIPSLVNLPGNLVIGFEETLKFGTLDSDAENIQESARAALQKCNTAPVSGCGYSQDSQDTTEVDVGDEKTAIVNSFGSSLEVVRKVATDPYFGVQDFQATADDINEIKEEMNGLSDKMPCGVVKPTFCHLYDAANGISEGMSAVNEALDEFEHNPQVATFEQYASFLVALHGMPYILILGMLCLMVFWHRSHKGCCPHGCCYLPFLLFWLASFIIYSAVLATGIIVTQLAATTPLEGMHGSPTLDVFLTHIQTDYKAFWDVVFADMIAGLEQLLMASYFFVVVAVLILFYSLCLCCCRPYEGFEDGKGDSGEYSGGAYRGPGTESQGRQFIAALHAEYCDGQGAMVGAFLDPLGPAGNAFLPYEERIRAAGNKEQEINNLSAEWGLPTGSSV